MTTENQSNGVQVYPADHSVVFKTKHGEMKLKFQGLWNCQLSSDSLKIGKGKRERQYNEFSARFIYDQTTQEFDLVGLANCWNKSNQIKSAIACNQTSSVPGRYRLASRKASIAHKREIYDFSKSLINTMSKHFADLRRNAHIDDGNDKIEALKRDAAMYEGYAAAIRERIKEATMKQIEEMALLSNFGNQ